MAKNKNPGPALVSKKNGALDVISPEWRAKLGLTVTEQKQPEDINPTAVASTLIESRVDADQTNERNKVNTEIGSPTGVTISEKILTDGVESTRAKTIVTENAALPAISHLTVDSKQRAWGTGLAEQEVVTVPSWPVRLGQEYDPLFEFTVGYSKQLKATGSDVNNPLTDSRPIDHKTNEVTIYEPPTAAILAKSFVTQQMVSVRIPDELTSLTAVWEVSAGQGAYDEDGYGASVGATAQLALSPSGRASGSAAVMPDLIPEDVTFNDQVLCPVYHFFMASPTSVSGMLSRLTTLHGQPVLQWPKFKPQRLRVALRGQKVAVEASANLAISVSVSESAGSVAATVGAGSGVDIGSVLRVVTLGPYIHGAITIAGDLVLDEDADALAFSNSSSGTNWPGGSVTSPATATAEGSVVGYQLAATSPAAVPREGFYALVLAAETWKFGFMMFRVAVVNFADL